MKLYLSSNVKIKDIQKKFKNSFPYLKLEFFKKHAFAKGNPNNNIVSANSTLIDVTGVTIDGEIQIKGRQTVAELEELFQSRFNLPVQIFRKIRYSWIDITKTDHLQLQKHNIMGREACSSMYDEVVLL